jgi:hypothetical protein
LYINKEKERKTEQGGAEGMHSRAITLNKRDICKKRGKEAKCMHTYHVGTGRPRSLWLGLARRPGNHRSAERIF